jgi:hypothetical protein
MRRLVQVLGGLLFVGATVAVVFLVGMRKKSPALQGAVRKMNKAVTNPQVMKTAGGRADPRVVRAELERQLNG